MAFILSEERADLIAAAIQDIHASLPDLDLENVDFGEAEWISCLADALDNYDLKKEDGQIIQYAILRVSKNTNCWELFGLPDIQEDEGDEIQSCDLAESARLLFEHMVCRDRNVCNFFADESSIPVVDGSSMPIYKSLCHDIMNTDEFMDDRPANCSGFSFKVIYSSDKRPTWEIQWL